MGGTPVDRNRPNERIQRQTERFVRQCESQATIRAPLDSLSICARFSMTAQLGDFCEREPATSCSAQERREERSAPPENLPLVVRVDPSRRAGVMTRCVRKEVYGGG